MISQPVSISVERGLIYHERFLSVLVFSSAELTTFPVISRAHSRSFRADVGNLALLNGNASRVCLTLAFGFSCIGTTRLGDQFFSQ